MRVNRVSASRLAAMLLVLAASGAGTSNCAPEPDTTLVRLRVTSDEIGFRLASVHVLRRIGGSGIEPRQVTQVLPLGYMGQSLPILVNVRPEDASEEWVEFRVDGLGFEDEVIVARRAWTSFVRGQVVDLEVRLEAACGPGAVTCPVEEPCVGGACTPFDDPPGMGCGNGTVEADWYEECDDGNDEDADDCLASCQAARCGDGVLWTGFEECDDGNTEPGDECTADCTVALCGDGVVRTGIEECDDGNDEQGDACLDDCSAATCGDGVVRVGVEECDLEPDRPCATSCDSTGTESCMLCAWECEPPAETCNGLDDDCDAGTDEDFTCVRGTAVECITACGSTGSGYCTPSCGLPSGPACHAPVEMCNGNDDDCDGSADEGCACASGWETMDSGTTDYLYSIWGSGSDDVFAAGSGGTILHFGGVYWTRMFSGTTDTLGGIWGAGPSDVYAVGAYGTILHYNGGAWNRMPSGTDAHLDAVWGSGPTNVYASGSDGTILRGDGSSWIRIYSGTSAGLQAIGGSGEDDVYIVGRAPLAEATILHYNGSHWGTIDTGVSEYLSGVWSSGHDEAYVVGDWGTMLLLENLAFSVVTAPTTLNMQAIWGSDASRMFVTSFERMYVWNGVSWRQESTGATETLFAVWGTGPDNVFAVGGDGTIIHRCGSGW